MKARSILTRLLLLTAFLLLVLVGMAAPAWAQGPPDAPLPLPDLLIYGSVMREGQVLDSGVIKALLPGGGVVTAAIGPVSGTGYSYVLKIPLRQYDANATVFDANSARIGESISFQIDDAPAMFRNPNGVVANAFTIPSDGVGGTYRLDLFLSGPDAYPLGDVNASGRRDSADALLVLKYDVGLIEGVTTFPPGPRTVYLPLCDIVQDGVCNASDALRILQCDVGMSGVDCPNSPAAATQQEQVTSAAGQLLIHLQVEPEAGGEQVTVRVLAADPQMAFGAATLELVYDLQQLTPVSCQESLAENLDMASCNPSYAPGVARLNALSVGGLSGESELAVVSFHMNQPLAEDELLRSFALSIVGAVDRQGAGLPWQLAAPELIPIPPTGNTYPLYLPLLWSFQVPQLNDVAPADIPVPEGGRRLYLPLLWSFQTMPKNDFAPADIPADIPVPEETQRHYLPLLIQARGVAVTGNASPNSSDLEPSLYLPQLRR